MTKGVYRSPSPPAGRATRLRLVYGFVASAGAARQFHQAAQAVLAQRGGKVVREPVEDHAADAAAGDQLGGAQDA
jgi:hypothetical protein